VSLVVVLDDAGADAQAQVDVGGSLPSALPTGWETDCNRTR
jgi:hypothetical protein